MRPPRSRSRRRSGSYRRSEVDRPLPFSQRMVHPPVMYTPRSDRRPIMSILRRPLRGPLFFRWQIRRPTVRSLIRTVVSDTKPLHLFTDRAAIREALRPRQTLNTRLCVDRKVRKGVMFAQGVAGGPAPRRKRLTPKSFVRCT